jgi:hypothetical protein
MFFRLRPEPRLPLFLSLLFLLAIGTYEAGKYKTNGEAVRISAVRTVIDAELAQHRHGYRFEDLAQKSVWYVVDTYAGENALMMDPDELGALSIVPVFHKGSADAFALSITQADAKRCQMLAAFPDSRVTRTLVNGHVVRDGLQMPSGYALQGACTENSTVTLEISPSEMTPVRS